MTSSQARRYVQAARAALEPLRDGERAVPMAAYMKHQFPFLGIASPGRRAALTAAWAALEPITEPVVLAQAAQGLWALPEREYQYAACDLLDRRVRMVDADFLVQVIEPLITTSSWWDSVDGLQGAAVGPLVRRHRGALVPVIRRWIASPDRWLVRSAIIHQLGYGADTDEDLLFELCAQRSSEREFFIAKAIGWALRTHARRRPDAVRAFVEAHPELAPLSRREALKHLG